jgi:hypothetical protein
MAQLKLQVNVDEPVDKNSAHAIGDISLRSHIIGTRLVFDLKLAQMLVNVLDVLHHIVGLITVGSVNIEDRNCWGNLAAEEALKATYKCIAIS